MSTRRSRSPMARISSASLLWVAVAGALGCAHDVHEMAILPGPSIDLDKARTAQSKLLRELSCRSCMAEDAAICARARDFPVVAAVSGAHLLRDFSTCRHERPPMPTDGHTCGHITALQFDAVVSLSDVKAETADVFREFYTHDYSTPDISEGVSLAPGERYVVFATRGGSGKPHAKWDIGIACTF